VAINLKAAAGKWLLAGTFAYAKAISHRNRFRIQLRQV